jgi:hypothetical protein
MKLPRSLTYGVGRTILKFKKDSPHIFFVAGVVGTVASTVMACRATMKLSETLDEIQDEVTFVKGANSIALAHSSDTQELSEVNYRKDYSEVDYRKDLAYVYIKSGIKITRLYGPAFLVGAASIGALTGSHIQLTRRNAAVMAAYGALQKAYDEYRERVREQVGEDRELDLHHGAKTEVAKIDGKNQEVKVVDPNTWSQYARFFDEYNSNWLKDPEMNLMFLKCQQNYANERLRTRGHVFLNDVYDSLGMERSSAGSVVGWVINKDESGDNFVDFGIYEAYNSRFVAGSERSVMLDFNVDGVIWDKI